jgi:hypothetical protein
VAVVLFFLRPQPNDNWSPAPDEAHVDSARDNMAAQCGAGGQPKFAHIIVSFRVFLVLTLIPVLYRL